MLARRLCLTMPMATRLTSMVRTKPRLLCRFSSIPAIPVQEANTWPPANQALAATIASGIRSIFAYSHAPYFTRWDSQACELSRDILPKSSIGHIFQLAAQQPHGDGRVNIGFGFDYWFLPKEAVVTLFSSLRRAGVKLFTAHYANNATFGKLHHCGNIFHERCQLYCNCHF